MSPHIKDGAAEIGAWWTLTDACKAHDMLDALEESERNARQRAREEAANDG